MFFLSYLFFILLFLLVCAGVAWIAVELARKRSIEGWKWGSPVFMVMLGLVFWDWLPMEISYRYKCNNYAGFTQIKTLDEWKQENPGIWETLSPKTMPEKYLVKVDKNARHKPDRHYRLPDGTELRANFDIRNELSTVDMLRSDGTKGFWLNQRFAWETHYDRHWFQIFEREERIVDLKTGEIIVQKIDFGTSIPPLGIGGGSLSDYKFWLQKSTCEVDKARPLERKFRLFKYLIEHQMEYE